MTRWIVNPRTHEVRIARNYGAGVYPEAAENIEEPCEGEFFFNAPTAADAAMAGRRHNLAVEALETLEGELEADGFRVIGERLEFVSGAGAEHGINACLILKKALERAGFEVWREGLALLVLARRVQGTEGIHAWVSEIGSDR